MAFQAPFDTMEYARLRMTAEQQQQQQQQAQAQEFQKGITQGIGGLVDAYMGRERDKATATAFGNILEMHGQTMFGEKAGDLLDRYKKGTRQEQLAMAGMLTGQPGQQIGRMNYLNRSGEIYGGGGSGGGGGGGAGGGGYTVGQGWE